MIARRFEFAPTAIAASRGRCGRGCGPPSTLSSTFRQLTDAEAARLIHADGVDILIDLKGFTHGARTSVMMLRPAPVQVNYLGYPGTLGTGVCDYIVTDRYVTPPSSAPAYSEAFAYLPHSYQPHGRGTPLRAPPSRAAAGLPAEGFVFCCFNQAYKFTPFIFDLWARLLEATPGACFGFRRRCWRKAICAMKCADAELMRRG